MTPDYLPLLLWLLVAALLLALFVAVVGGVMWVVGVGHPLRAGAVTVALMALSEWRRKKGP